MEDRSNDIAKQLVESVIHSYGARDDESQPISTGPIGNDCKDKYEIKQSVKGEVWASLPHNNSFRFFCLEPAATSESDLRGHLCRSRLSNPPDYEAMSYSWGDRIECCTLYIASDATLSITQHLDTALRSLRLPTEPRYLWIDAICIDQRSLDEKAQQVAMMAQIFKNATQVICWLGPEVASTTESFNFLSRLCDNAKELGLRDIRETQPSRLTVRSLIAPEERSLDILEKADATKAGDVYARKYFTRLWVCQEVTVARKAIIQIGSHRLEWERFVMATLVILGAANGLNTSSRTLTTMAHAWSIMALRTKLKFHALPGMFVLSPYTEFGASIRSIYHHDCQDDRDRVYALIGLKPDNCAIDITPSYRKPITEVYTDFAREFLRYDVYLLFDAGLCQRQGRSEGQILEDSDMFGSGHLPSWVPDYRLSRAKLQEFPWQMNSFITATGIPPLVNTSLDTPARISVRGFILDVVESVVGLQLPEDSPDELDTAYTRSFIETWFAIVHESAVRREIVSADDSTLPEAELRYLNIALLLNGMSEELNQILPQPAREELLLAFQAFVKYNFFANDSSLASKPNLPELISPSAVSSSNDSSNVTEVSMAKAYHDCLTALLVRYRLRFLMTEYDGLLGWAPRMTEQSDVVAILDGAQMPFILRPVKTLKLLPDNKHETLYSFQLIGPCCIQGVMEGETTMSNHLFQAGWTMIPID